MQQGDIIRITDVQRLGTFSGQIRNVYYYQAFTMTGEAPLQIYAEDILAAFFTTVLTPLLAIQAVSLEHIEVEFFNMSFQQEEVTQTWDVPLQGTVAGEYMPANVAYSFKLQRYSRVVRNGAKRISGVPEVATQGGRLLNPAYQTVVSAAANAFAQPLTVEGDSVDALLNPVIVRVPSNPGVVPTVFSTITEGSFRGFGTQNTRKQL